MNKFDWQLLKRFWKIAKPYWFSNEKWGARGLLAFVVFLALAVNALNVGISFVARYLDTALANRDQPTSWRFLLIYAAVFVVGTPIVVYSRYINKKLGVHWRDWLTKHLLNKYFSNRAYYETNSNEKIDNPDQRISEDVREFTRTSLTFFVLIISSIIGVISFTGVLWSISVQLSLFLLGYAVFGNVVILILANKLIGLNFKQIKREANFRYGLVHVRDNAESIAFYRGEEQESFQVKERFVEAISNFHFLIGWERNVDFFKTGYGYLVIILPYLIVLPIYFAGKTDFGTISQAAFAFNRIMDAISVIVDQIERLSLFAAGINRLATFTEFLDAPTTAPQGTTSIDTVDNGRLALEHVTLQTPNHKKTLVADLSVPVQPSEGLLIVGQSGVGKSSLLRAIAGLWKSGTGRLVRPQLEDMLFLPQRPYMLLGNLRTQLLYPNTEREVTDAELQKVLEQVNLADLPERVGGFDAELDWADVLSLGEQQRLAFARLLLTKPQYAILDEATSALDLKNEASLYQQLKETHTTFVSVGHRSSLLQYHQYVLELTGDTNWRLMSTEDYAPNAGSFG